jgi:hypothetical protein
MPTLTPILSKPKRGTQEKLGGETILKDLAVIASAGLPRIDKIPGARTSKSEVLFADEREYLTVWC